MPSRLDEIVAHQERLQAEILERECLLAAFNVLHRYAASGHNLKSMDLVTLASALPAAASRALLVDAAPAQLPAPEPAPDVKPYIHPELEELLRPNGTHVAIVRWAIGRMTKDFSLADIRRLLQSEGSNLGGPEISVVLTRLKRQARSNKSRAPTDQSQPFSANLNPALRWKPTRQTRLKARRSRLNPRSPNELSRHHFLLAALI